MADDETAHEDRDRPRDEAVTPSLIVRVLGYGAGWLPCFWLLTFRVPTFAPIFRRLAEFGKLPRLTEVVLAVAEYDATYGHAPALLAFLAILAVDAGVMRYLGRDRRRRAALWLWFAGVIAAGIASAVVVEVALVLPVYTMKGAVE
jgi:hypothetical protein